MADKKDKNDKAVKAIEKAVRKAMEKGVTAHLIAQTVDKALGKAIDHKRAPPKKGATATKTEKPSRKNPATAKPAEKVVADAN